jgi:hypothetical protein
MAEKNDFGSEKTLWRREAGANLATLKIPHTAKMCDFWPGTNE